MRDSGLKGKGVLVTGGNNPYGIGAATARAFASEGAAVFIQYLRQSHDLEQGAREQSDPHQFGLPFFFAQQKKSADEVVQSIREQGGQADSWECDLGKLNSIVTLFDRAERVLGNVEVLVNNAAEYAADTFVPKAALKADYALWEGGPLTSPITAESHDRHFAVNTRAPALLMAEYARRHIENKRSWGTIINVSADCSWGCPGEISYRASKYALESYSRSAAAELGPFGITVNIVAPGPVQTGYMSEQIEGELVTDIPLRRVGQAEDVADVIVFLASKQAGWVTGQLLCVHGGHRMSLGR
jgi:3-oxoacyl-[acyl-carrier protein] reductase